MSEAFQEGRRRGFRPVGERTPIKDPSGMLEAVKNQTGEIVATEVFTEYERDEEAGGWRCYLRIPALGESDVANFFNGEDKTFYGIGPTKEEARDVAVGWFQEQVRNGRHLSDRLRVEDMMRGRRMS